MKVQPGEDAAKVQKRRVKVKNLMEKAVQAFCAKMAILTNLRNRRDQASSSKRVEYREPESLKTQCRVLWDLLGGLCERGSEERGFLQEIRRELRRASEEGSQAARRRGPQPSQAPESEEISVSKEGEVEDGSGNTGMVSPRSVDAALGRSPGTS